MRLSALSILPMTPAHIAEAQVLSAAVGWPHRVEDWAFVLALGHGLVALEGEELVGVAIWWPLGKEAATLGMVIVAPVKQGQGLGRRLMEAALADAGSRSVLLNATQEGLPLYRKMGFEQIGTICQHQGRPPAAEAPEASAGMLLRPMEGRDLKAVIALDSAATGLPRSAMLRALAVAGQGLVLEVDDRLQGYAIYRKFGRGHVIGPVVAGDGKAAKALIGAWIAQHGGGFLRIDVPVTSDLSGWLDSRGLPKVSEVVTMARGTPPVTDPPTTDLEAPQVFALASQALG